MIARFPSTCATCNGPIASGEEIVDSGLRGPQGGKKMAHANCGGATRNPEERWAVYRLRSGRWVFADDELGFPAVFKTDHEAQTWAQKAGYPKDQVRRVEVTRQNPRADRSAPWTRAYNNPMNNGLGIPSDWPASAFEYGPRPRLAGGSSDYEWGYEQFSRSNPGLRRKLAHEDFTAFIPALERGDAIDSYWSDKNGGLVAVISFPGGREIKLRGASAEALAAKRRERAHPRARQNTIRLPQPDYFEMPSNAGPYLPAAFPTYGVFGRPAAYEAPKANKTRTRKNPSWPINDREHALIALQYMTRGFGQRAQYANIIRKIAKAWPPEDEQNRAIWTFYRRNKNGIERMAGLAVPDMLELRHAVAVANPRKRRR
jgi:hypothetical protein